jgi:hypothetical protein
VSAVKIESEEPRLVTKQNCKEQRDPVSLWGTARQSVYILKRSECLELSDNRKHTGIFHSVLLSYCRRCDTHVRKLLTARNKNTAVRGLTLHRHLRSVRKRHPLPENLCLNLMATNCSVYKNLTETFLKVSEEVGS